MTIRDDVDVVAALGEHPQGRFKVARVDRAAQAEQDLHQRLTSTS
jgi:hypothetical protein